ncbi:MAG TPA: LysR family transcriptional regulator [Caulobacteraceae bacterium]
MDINQLDLNLIVTLEVLLAERNVSRAARRLNLSQPALSARLNRLRDIFGDPLLLPAQRGMVPTPRALELQEPLHAALDGLRQVIAQGAPFDASRAAATVAIAASDYVQVAVLMPLIRTLRDLAPGLRFVWRTLDPGGLRAQLEHGEVDLALMMPQGAPDSLRMITLYHERYVAIVRRDHPRVSGPLDLDLFCELEHIVVSPLGGGFQGPTDLILEASGRYRRVVLSAPAFLVVPEMIARSDLIAVVPERLVRHHTDKLQVIDPPLTVPGFDIALVWHDRTTAHPIHRWLREQIVRGVRPRTTGLAVGPKSDG